MGELINLTSWDKARQAIVECKNIDEVKNIRDQAVALKAYAKQQKESLEMQNNIAEIKLRAERRIGEFSRELPKEQGGITRYGSPHDEENRDGERLTKTEVLKEAGIAIKTVNRFEAIAEMPEEEFEKHIQETKESKKELTSTGMIREAKRIKQEEKNKEVISRAVKRIDGKYDVIVIDPPWPMVKIESDCRPNQVGFDYPTMTIEEIGNISLPASDDCHLWLWTTHKFLPDSFSILKKWDFRYVCTFVWHKPGGMQPFELPQYNCEFILYARKGSPKFVDTKQFFTCFCANRKGHSVKPDEFYDVVKRVAGGKRIDMFSRRELDGFDTWGNEVD